MAGAHGKLVVGAGGVWLVVAFTHKTMPRYPLMNLIPTDWQEEAGAAIQRWRQQSGLWLHGAAYLNDVLLPTGLSARQLISSRQKITHPAISALRTLFRRRMAG
ncbi:hypothetical protein LQQ74_27395 (plasmid) [Escherichia coli]|nr:hypothetical protein LQQ74_27395 [Escherichia coli]